MSTPTKTEHTPGPWKATEHGEIFSPEPTPSHVASVNQFPNHSESEANARLMAAAPEMIHALELAHVALARRGCGCDCENMPAPCVMCAVKTAIAKAKGEK